MFRVRSQNVPPVYTYQSNWEYRKSGVGVVWAHDFETDEEVDTWLNMAQQAPFNSFCTFGVHDRILYAHRTAANAASLDRPYNSGEVEIPYAPGLRGQGCLQLVNLGATLAADLVANEAMATHVGWGGTFVPLLNGPAYNKGYVDIPQLPTAWIIDSNTVADKLLLRFSGGTLTSEWALTFSCTQITSLGSGLYRYYLTRPSALPSLLNTLNATGFTVEACLLGDDANHTCTITLDSENAPYFPNPNNDPAKYYNLAIHSGERTTVPNGDVPQGTVWFPVYPGQTAGSKGVKEYVTVLSKSGNVLTVRRGGTFAERASFSNWGFPTKFIAGTPIGNDCDGGWARWFSRVTGAENGIGVDDPGANNSVPFRERGISISSDQNKQGYYGNSFYHTLYPTFAGHTAPWDGTDFYLQFRYYISPNRLDQAMQGQKLWFIDSMNGLTAHQCIGKGLDTFSGQAYIGIFGNKGAEEYEDPQGTTTGAFLQPDDQNPDGSEFPTYVGGNAVGGRRWVVGEWLTVNIHLTPGFARDDRCPNTNDQNDSPDELTVVVDPTDPATTPVNNGVLCSFDTTVPQDWNWSPVSRSVTNYFRNFGASWPSAILGTPSPQVQVLRTYSTLVESSTLVTRNGGQRIRWVLKQRGTQAFPPAGVVPANGDWMYVNVTTYGNGWDEIWNDMPGGTPNLKADGYDMEIVRSNGERWHPMRKSDYALMYGSEGENKFGNDPPGWNRFQPTGYANINDNLSPFPKTTFTRFGQVIFSKAPIPDPDDSGSPGQSTAPQWFDDMDADTWYSIADGSDDGTWQGGTSLYQSVPNITTEYDDLCMNNNGGTVALDYREFILALNGGHSGNYANDAYALALNSNQPGWYQVVEPTPEQYTDIRITPATPAGNYHTPAAFPADGITDYPIDSQSYGLAQPFFVPAIYSDGSAPVYTRDVSNKVLPGTFDHTVINCHPKSLHTNNHTHYHNGKVWWPIMNAPNSGSGPTHLHKLSLDFQGIKNNPSLSTWAFGTLGPWQYHGPITGWPTNSIATGPGDFGTAALDRTTGLIWYRGQNTDRYWAMETTGASAGSHHYFTGAPSPHQLSSNGSAICHLTDTGGNPVTLWVMMEADSSTPSFYIKIADVTAAPGSTPTWTRQVPLNTDSYEWAYGIKNFRVPPDPTFAGYAMGYGMVWHAPSQCFLVYNCDQMPHLVDNVTASASIRKLSPPLVNGQYNAAGQWSWSEVTLSSINGAPEVLLPSKGTAGGGASSHSRFNIFPDFDGLGNALIIHQSRYDAPTWVAKIGVI